MLQEVLIDIKVIEDVDELKLVFVTNKRTFAKIFQKQKNLSDVNYRLLELSQKFDEALQSRVAEQRDGADLAQHSGTSSAANKESSK